MKCRERGETLAGSALLRAVAITTHSDNTFLLLLPLMIHLFICWLSPLDD